ncbi:MAG: hypothetical protein R6V62_09830 [Candidatus Fermentibacteraceae bacterium]
MSRSLTVPLTILLTVSAVTIPWLGLLMAGEGMPVGLPADPADVVVEGDSDVYDAVWHFWWTERALSESLDPMFCPLVFYPRGASMSLHNIGWPTTLIMANPLFTGDPVSALNLALFFGTALVFAAGVLLARQWGAGWDGAFLAGFIVALMPSRAGHLYQHYMIAQMGWGMFSLYFFTDYLKRGRGLPFAGLFAALATLESFYHVIFVFFGAISVMIILRRGFTKATAFRALASITLGVALAALWFIPREGGMATDAMTWREAVHWSAEPLSYLMPSPFGLAGAVLSLPLKHPWMPNAFEGNVSFGLSVLLVFIGACARKRRWDLCLIVLFLAVLSLGPLLKWKGTPTPVVLPWMAPARFSLLANARVPARISMLAGVIAAVTAGVACKGLKPLLRTLVLFFVLFELFIPVFPTLYASVPDACLEATGPVLDLPAGYMTRITAFYQTRHGQPRLTAFLARGGCKALEDANLSGLLMGDSAIVTVNALMATAAETALYHRMLLEPDQRVLYDSLYAPAFPSGTPDDSVWVWRR